MQAELERQRQQALKEAELERQAKMQAELEREAEQQADLLLQITTGNIKQALSLVRKGETDLTLTNADEETATHLASRLGQRGVLLALLQAGADPSCGNIHGDRPMDLAKDAATRKCFNSIPQRPVKPPFPTDLTRRMARTPSWLLRLGQNRHRPRPRAARRRSKHLLPPLL